MRGSNRNSIRPDAAHAIAARTVRQRKADTVLGMRTHRFAGSAARLAEVLRYDRFGFLQDHVADPSFRREECERDHGAVGHGEPKPLCDAVAFSLARAFRRTRVTDFLNSPKMSQWELKVP